MHTVRVALGSRSYPIHIGAGLLAEADLLEPVVGAQRVAIISNEIVAPLYLERVQRTLAAIGARVGSLVLPDGEPTKDWRTLERVFDWLLRERYGRDTLIVALGGGVIGDLAGFAAAVYQRGVPFVQLPTTLLAQVDSSVGGKTAINHARGKNMVGAFHQPLAVLADVATLDTLPEREFRSGLAEVIKHGLVLDAEFFAWLEANIDRILRREADAIATAVRRCCELKAAVVAADERESGARALLNFGHTFGHAIEAAMGYGAWLHGEAVAAGMVMAAELSVAQGLIQMHDVARTRDLLRRAGLPVAGPDFPPERLLELMQGDKKAAGGRLRFVLMTSIGAATLRGDIDAPQVRAALLACRQTGGSDGAPQQ